MYTYIYTHLYKTETIDERIINQFGKEFNIESKKHEQILANAYHKIFGSIIAWPL